MLCSIMFCYVLFCSVLLFSVVICRVGLCCVVFCAAALLGLENGFKGMRGSETSKYKKTGKELSFLHLATSK